MTGLVISNLGSRYEVLPDGADSPVLCAAKGNLRIKGIRTTNPVAVGDRVVFTQASDGEMLAVCVHCISPIVESVALY